jgi:hypothetical protein
MLSLVVNDSQDFEPTDSVVASAAERGVGFLASTVFDVTLLVPIRGVSTTVATELPGTGGVYVRPMTGSELNQLIDVPGMLMERHPSFDFTTRHIEPEYLTCVSLVGRYDKIVGSQDFTGAPDDQTDRVALVALMVVTSLRLMGDFGVALGPSVKLPPLWPWDDGSRSVLWEPLNARVPRIGEPEPIGHALTLDGSNVDRFRSMFEDLHGGAYQQLAVSLNRFRQACTHADPEDRLIDLIIAAEGLFSKDDESQGEITYKLSRRGASVPLGWSPGLVIPFLHKSYSLRSRLVHGGSVKKKKWPRLDGSTTTEISDVAADLEAFMRAALNNAVRTVANTGTRPDYDSALSEALETHYQSHPDDG